MRTRRLLTHLTQSLRGQSLVELAMVLPILLLITVGAVDLGRAYFSGITVENAAREGAFFGARKPACDDVKTGCEDPNTVRWHVEEELDGLTPDEITVECFADGMPVSLADCSDGDQYRVTVSTQFSLVTPIMSSLVGDQLRIASTATSVVVTSFQPIDQPAVAIPTAQPTDPPPNTCTVPSFQNTKYKDAASVWANVAGFSGTVTIAGSPNLNHKVAWQSLPAFSAHACTTSITVAATAQATPTPEPTPTPSPTPDPDAEPTPTPDPDAEPTPTPAPTPTPTPVDMCTVPNLVTSPRSTVTQAHGLWVGAGFVGSNLTPHRPPHDDYQVRSQSLSPGQSLACGTAKITVYDK